MINRIKTYLKQNIIKNHALSWLNLPCWSIILLSGAGKLCKILIKNTCISLSFTRNSLQKNYRNTKSYEYSKNLYAYLPSPVSLKENFNQYHESCPFRKCMCSFGPIPTYSPPIFSVCCSCGTEVISVTPSNCFKMFWHIWSSVIYSVVGKFMKRFSCIEIWVSDSCVFLISSSSDSFSCSMSCSSLAFCSLGKTF